jgi:hypothetical protein
MTKTEELILQELQHIRKDVADARVEIAKLQVKSTLWGAAGAVIILIPAYIFHLLTK